MREQQGGRKEKGGSGGGRSHLLEVVGVLTDHTKVKPELNEKLHVRERRREGGEWKGEM